MQDINANARHKEQGLLNVQLETQPWPHQPGAALLASLSTLTAGLDGIFVAGCVWDCVFVPKLCLEPNELYSSASPSFPILHRSPGHGASGSTSSWYYITHRTGAKSSEEDKSFLAFIGNGFLWSSFNLALPETLQRRPHVLPPTSQHLPGRWGLTASCQSCLERNKASLALESRMAGTCVLSQLCTVRGSPLFLDNQMRHRSLCLLGRFGSIEYSWHSLCLAPPELLLPMLPSDLSHTHRRLLPSSALAPSAPLFILSSWKLPFFLTLCPRLYIKG